MSISYKENFGVFWHSGAKLISKRNQFIKERPVLKLAGYKFKVFKSLPGNV